MTAIFSRTPPVFPFLARAALVVVSLLVAAWVVWAALLAALIAVPAVAIAAVVARLSRRQAPPQRGSRSDGIVIDGEYRVIPPER